VHDARRPVGAHVCSSFLSQPFPQTSLSPSAGAHPVLSRVRPDAYPECLMTPATCVQTKTTAEDIVAAPCVASAGIVGGSGYTGALLAELLLHHPRSSSRT
jgi:formaldehyde-activating enzyme involved in methanogenesis